MENKDPVEEMTGQTFEDSRVEFSKIFLSQFNSTLCQQLFVFRQI